MRFGIANSETDRNAIEKSRFGQAHAAGPEIIADFENQFIDARLQRLARQDWRIAAPVRIGHMLGEGAALVIVPNGLEREFDACPRVSVRRIEAMFAPVPYYIL